MLKKSGLKENWSTVDRPSDEGLFFSVVMLVHTQACMMVSACLHQVSRNILKFLQKEKTQRSTLKHTNLYYKPPVPCRDMKHPPLFIPTADHFLFHFTVTVKTAADKCSSSSVLFFVFLITMSLSFSCLCFCVPRRKAKRKLIFTSLAGREYKTT